MGTSIGLFEAGETIRQTWARSYVIELLDQYDLRKKIIAYVKDEGVNLNAKTIILKFVVDCEVLSTEDSF